MTVRKLAPWPWHDDDEIAAATAVLRSGRVNYWTGDEGRAFVVSEVGNGAWFADRQGGVAVHQRRAFA